MFFRVAIKIASFGESSQLGVTNFSSFEGLIVAHLDFLS